MKTIYWIEGPWSGRVAIVARPRGGDWLEDDIRTWKQNGMDIIVSLLTKQEREELQLTQEAQESSRRGIQFLDFPIVDRSIPSSLRDMKTLVNQLVALVSQGKNVGIHCRQGIGRSGLLVASLLVNAGIQADPAFQQIEKARGTPVPDTPEQRQWVEQFATLIAMSPKNFTYYTNLLKKHFPELQKQFSVKSLGIFGSYVRGQQNEESDLDVLVNFDELPSLLKFISLEDRLSELTGLQIDLVMEDSLKPNIGKRVLQEVVLL